MFTAKLWEISKILTVLGLLSKCLRTWKLLQVNQNFKFRNCGKIVKGVRWGCSNKKCVSKIYTAEGVTIILGDLFR